MEDLCRLCCSTSFVNNNIFDEENALYLKMSLYLPIKVFKNDRLPQKVCDKCSCKVNDFYQFCNETIEVQHRLRAVFLPNGLDSDDVVDLTRIKENVSPVPNVFREQSTQTEAPQGGADLPSRGPPPPHGALGDAMVRVKIEPTMLSPIKEEAMETFNDGEFCEDSDDQSLIKLKKKKKSKRDLNGVKKRPHKKKDSIADWDTIMSALPEGTALSVVKNGALDWEPGVKREAPEPAPAVSVKAEPEDAFHCCICFMQCYSKSDMLGHYRQHAAPAEAGAAGEAPPAPPPPPGEPLRCARCRKTLARGEWAAHWARHWERDSRPYRCALCEKTFRDPHQILKHGQTHKLGAGEEAAPLKKRFVCDLCPEGFVYMRYLLAHRTRAHPEARARALVLRCSVCARQFAHLNSLRRHLRAHSGERNYLCNVCGKSLSSREHLKFHIRIHTGYKPNVCKTCGKGFVKKCNLTLHERVHSGEKPHVCAHCGKAFSQRSTLVIHERYHSGARPYACPHCARAFVAKGLLSMHLKTTCIW